MSRVNIICRAVLTEAQSVGTHDPLVAELVERCEAGLRFEEIAEVARALEQRLPVALVDRAVASLASGLDNGRSGPLSDAELLDALVAAGPHRSAVNALVGMLAGVIAEHDGYARRMALEAA